MRFYVAKNNKLTCLHCKSNILYGEHYAWLYSYKAKRVFTFHIECFRKWVDINFVNKYLIWKENLNPPKKLGRPRKTSDPEKYHRLKALLRYHKKAGNEKEVQVVETKIGELEKGGSR